MQRKLRAPFLSRASRLLDDGDRVIIRYPCLSHDEWKELEPEDFWSNPVSCLLEFATILDYLHFMGVVHCDIKLANFLCRRGSRGHELRLVDLDFLMEAGGTLQALILGTPGHVAPEVLANDRAVAQSDNFSLGIVLERLLRAAPPDIDQSLRHTLEGFAGQLTQVDYRNRPKYLMAALRSSGVIDDRVQFAASKKLFTDFAISQYLLAKRQSTAGVPSVVSFLVNNCRLHGVSSSLLSAAAEVQETGRRHTRQVLLDVLKAGTFRIAGDFFSVEIDDHTLLGAYRSLASIACHSNGPKFSGAVSSLFEDYHWREARYLERFQAHQQAASGTSATELGEMAREAYALNRLRQASCLYDLLLQAVSSSGCSLADLQAAIVTRVKLNDLDGATSLCETGLALAQDKKDVARELSMLRIRAWLWMLRNDYVNCKTTLEDVIQRSKELRLGEVEAMALYTLGAMHWRRGVSVEAVRYLEDCIAVAKESGVDEPLVPAYSTLSLLRADTADYSQACHEGATAIDLAVQQGKQSLIAPTCLVLAYAYTRLANAESAGKWLQRYLVEISASQNDSLLLSYYQTTSFSLLWQGAITEAEEAALAAAALGNGLAPDKIAGKTHHTLAECALLRGHLERLAHHVKAGAAIFDSTGDTPSRVELESLEHLGRVLYSHESPSESATQVVERLIEHQCIFYVCTMLLRFLALDVVRATDTVADRCLAFLTPHIQEQGVPQFKALANVCRASENAGALRGWKDAFSVLLGSGDTLSAVLVAGKIGSLYRGLSHFKHAKKYYEQATRLAFGLGNAMLKERLGALAASAGDQGRDRAMLIRSFADLSVVLRDLHEYPTVLQRLAQFAVEQTGAERGVILLKSGNAAALSIGASVNCDDASLSDIVDFSQSISRNAVTSIDTVLIENALRDDRTKVLPSVVLHNIMSVAAVPLVLDGATLGVLYLDHHSIPSLFEPDDLTYIQTIANFTSVALQQATSYSDLRLRAQVLHEQLGEVGVSGNFISRDASMARLFERLDRVAQMATPVLLLGESGTGKELIAERIHASSPRQKRSMVRLNCAALPPLLVESELFGIVKGAATGVGARDGKLSVANGSTLFLDEIGDLSLDVQAKLLRVVEYQEFEKVGSNRSIHVDVRFIYATNKNLKDMVSKGLFREDLFYRINVVVVEVPPLRERVGDIPLLAEHYLKVFSGGRKLSFLPSTLNLLNQYTWPGNVRELRNVIERCCILSVNDEIAPDLLPEPILTASAVERRSPVAETLEANRIRSALERAGGNRSHASRALGIPLTSLRRKIRKYNLGL